MIRDWTVAPKKGPGLWLEITTKKGERFQAWSKGLGCLPLLTAQSFVLERLNVTAQGYKRHVPQTFYRKDLLAVQVLQVVGAMEAIDIAHYG